MISFCTSTKTKLSLTIFDKITEHGHLWEQIIPKDHSLNLNNLLTVENAQPDGMNFNYVLVHRKSELIGVVYLQHLKIISSHFDGTKIDKPGLGWLKKSIQSQFSEVLICGNLFRIHFPGYYFRHAADNPLIFEILYDYFHSKTDKKRYCAILIKDSPIRFDDVGKFKPYRDDVTMEIEIQKSWQTMSDYKDCLSKKYKQRYLKILRSKKTLHLKILRLDEIEQSGDLLEHLYLNVALKQSLRIGLVSKRYFFEFKKHLGENFNVVGYYHENTLIGFSSHIFYPNKTMEIHFIGIDYSYNEKYNLYFNILFDGLETAILSQSKRLELGRTARIAKASLGAEPVEVFNYIYLRNGIPAMTFSFFNAWFMKNIGEDWKNRNPFKRSV